MRTEFVSGCQRLAPEGPGMELELAERLWEQVAAFSGYGFNEGHATAYADVSYRCAYVKAHWPAAYLCARLRDWGGYHHPAVYMAEAFRLGIEVQPPHVNMSLRSYGLFWVEQRPVIRMGLDLVRDLHRETIIALIAQRRQRAFASVSDLAQRVPMQAKELEHLIEGGALDGLGASRGAMLGDVTRIRRAGSAQQMAFDLGEAPAVTDTISQQVLWEKQVLGYPLRSVRLGLAQLRSLHPECVHVMRFDQQLGQRVKVLGVRLPGWGRRNQFYVWDGSGWVLARLPEGLLTAPSWEAVELVGRAVRDRWGGMWLQTESIQRLEWGGASETA